MKLVATQSQLVMVDIQTKLAIAMPTDAMQRVIKNAQILLQAAQTLEVSMIASEQYPQGLGETLPQIKQHIGACKPIEKTAFSIYNASAGSGKTVPPPTATRTARI